MSVAVPQQSAWLEQVLQRAKAIDDVLMPKRQAAIALLENTRWPGRKTEAWKYTSLYTLQNAAFDSAAPAANAAANKDLTIHIVNGKVQALPENLPQGLSIASFSNLSAVQQAAMLEQFSAIKPERHLFGLVNDALATEGLLIDVEAGADVAPLLTIMQSVAEGAEAHVRILVRIGKGAKLRLLEQFADSGKSFQTLFAEYAIAEDAELEHYRFSLSTAQAMNIGGCHFALNANARLNSTLVGFGSDVSRTDVDVIHAGEHANAQLNAVYLLDGEEQYDLHSTIEHTVPNCTTEENVRGIVADKARAIFNGRIHIHRDAQKTLAELNNRNLLLSRQAEVNTKPELEIYADDVRCAHGATVAEIDKKAMYYLQSRGIDRATAQVMLNFGFINELIDQMPDEQLAETLRPVLRQRFANMKVK